MKKFTALLLALVMALALCACGGGNTEPADTTPAEPAADAPAPAAPAAGDDFAEYKAYVAEYAAAGAPTEEEGQTVVNAIMACASVEELEAVSQLTVLFENGIVMTYADWIAAGKPAAQTEGMGIDPNAGSGEASGEATDEPAAAPADAADAGEPSEEPTGEPVAELYPADGFAKTLDGYKEYAETALRQDEHAPAEIVETTVESIKAATSGDDDAFSMLVYQGLILSYADFIAA